MSRLRGAVHESCEVAGMMRWLLTYADMITLLLALFVVLFAMSSISVNPRRDRRRTAGADGACAWATPKPT